MSTNQSNEKLIHVRAPNYINEHADQLVGITYGSGSESRVSVTFGRDHLNITSETLTQLAPGVLQAQPMPGDYTLTRMDFATISMSLDAAIRFRDSLSHLIDVTQSATPQPS